MSGVFGFSAFVSAWRDLKPRIDRRIEKLGCTDCRDGSDRDFQRLITTIDNVIRGIDTESFSSPDTIRDSCVFVMGWQERDDLAREIWSLVSLYRRVFAETRTRQPF